MKNTILVLVSIFLVSCSSDDKDSNNPPSNNYVSNINVNFHSFQPSNSATHLYTSLTNGVNSGEANQRVFYMRQVDNGLNSGNEYMEIKITYPVGQVSINGTYAFSTSNLPSNSVATGEYVDDTNLYLFNAGFVSITDLGNNNYRVEFNNAKVSPFSSLQLPVTGYFQGLFY